MSVESRRRFIHQIGKAIGSDEEGGQQVIADKLGLKHRQSVDNQIRHGFGHKWKPILLQLANEHGLQPHPELLTGKEKRITRYTTPIGKFVYELVQRYGGFRPLAREIGCPESTLRRMCERKGFLTNKYIPDLERVADKVGVQLPDFWPKNTLSNTDETAI